MGRGPLNFRQRDLTAAVKALENAGKKVSEVGLDKVGNIRILVGVANGNTGSSHAGKQSEWELRANANLEKARAKARLRKALDG